MGNAFLEKQQAKNLEYFKIGMGGGKDATVLLVDELLLKMRTSIPASTILFCPPTAPTAVQRWMVMAVAEPVRKADGLKACPFCGGKAEYVVTDTEHGNGTIGFGFAIKCPKCHTKNPKASGTIRMRLGADGELYIFDDARGMATTEWNRRSDDGN